MSEPSALPEAKDMELAPPLPVPIKTKPSAAGLF